MEYWILSIAFMYLRKPQNDINKCKWYKQREDVNHFRARCDCVLRAFWAAESKSTEIAVDSERARLSQRYGIDMRVVINKDNKILFLCGRFAMKTKKNVFAGGKCLHAMGTVRRWCVKRPFSQHFKPWHKLAWTDYYCRKLWHHRRTNLSPHQATCSTLSIRRFASLNNFPIKNRIKK